MKTILSLQLTMLLSLGFTIPVQSAEADGEKEIRKEKPVKESRPDREQSAREIREDVEKRGAREEREVPRRGLEEVRKDTPRREGEVRRDGEVRREGEPRKQDGEREGEVIGARRLNATLSKLQSPSVLLVKVGDAGKEMLLPIQPDTKIFISGKPASLEDLKPDMQLRLQQEGKLTRRIDARPGRARGSRDTGRKAGVREGDQGGANPAREKDPK